MPTTATANETLATYGPPFSHELATRAPCTRHTPATRPPTRHSGTTACAECATGRYSSNYSAIECDRCEAGSYATSTAARSCELCEAGYYINQSASAYCIECESGTYSTDGATICDICDYGYFMMKGACRECDGKYKAADCSDSRGLTLETLPLLVIYFIYSKISYIQVKHPKSPNPRRLKAPHIHRRLNYPSIPTRTP